VRDIKLPVSSCSDSKCTAHLSDGVMRTRCSEAVAVSSRSHASL